MQWIYGMCVDIMAYASGELIKVMSMDLTYFEQTAPVITTMVEVFIALGWAILLGNLVFQSIKSMMSGIGFESEEPKILFLRTFVFGFLLLSSRQICNIAMGITSKVIELLQIPSSLDIVTPDEGMFNLGASAKWLLVIIVGFILMMQIVKLLFEIGERYVVTSVLTFFAPLAFAMGGSKNTNDIFKGWCRMYGSMMIMMIMNIVFLKLIISAMTQISSGGVLVWLVFVIALTRVARKIDSHIGKMGLNPAQTGDGIGSRLPGMITMVAVRTLASAIGKAIPKSGGNKTSNASRGSGGNRNSFNNRTANSSNSNSNSNAQNNSSSSQNSNNNQSQSSGSSHNSSNEQTRNTGKPHNYNNTKMHNDGNTSHQSSNATSVAKSNNNNPPLNRNFSRNNIRNKGGNSEPSNNKKTSDDIEGNNSGEVNNVVGKTTVSGGGNKNSVHNTKGNNNSNTSIENETAKKQNTNNNNFPQNNSTSNQYEKGRYNPFAPNRNQDSKFYQKQYGGPMSIDKKKNKCKKRGGEFGKQ